MSFLLTAAEINEFLQLHQSWKLESGSFVLECAFPSFPLAIAFVDRIAALAEEADHHPDIDIRYKRVKLTLISHDARALTKRDKSMVEKIDRMMKISDH